ncbi:MAG: polyisoprenoid-binding protein [Sphaerobacteraceae bacterium]|nr:MAG: polyisoprenoid-binding protein [Sphaerobacteraceae bacterium]
MPDSNELRRQAAHHQHLTRWIIDPLHSEIRFSIRHLMISTVKGNFASFQGDLIYDHQLEQPAGVVVEIEAGSVETGQIQRDIHLRSGDFFDVENYPHIRFASRHVESIGNNHYLVHGDLRLLRETQQVVLDVTFEGIGEDAEGNQRASFSATTEINRHDFGLTWNRSVEAGGLMVGESVRIYLEIQAVQQ